VIDLTTTRDQWLVFVFVDMKLWTKKNEVYVVSQFVVAADKIFPELLIFPIQATALVNQKYVKNLGFLDLLLVNISLSFTVQPGQNISRIYSISRPLFLSFFRSN
jgi:hypothetical protein